MTKGRAALPLRVVAGQKGAEALFIRFTEAERKTSLI
jgi:hypothetical protein